MGVTTNEERDILGIWAGDGAEGARFWLQVFSELKNRGVEDVLIAVCDGLKGLPETISTAWEHGRATRHDNAECDAPMVCQVVALRMGKISRQM